MTIMLAGGMVIAAPSMMPVAHAANANLFVSGQMQLLQGPEKVFMFCERVTPGTKRPVNLRKTDSSNVLAVN
jgi:hypothetical protein